VLVGERSEIVRILTGDRFYSDTGRRTNVWMHEIVGLKRADILWARSSRDRKRRPRRSIEWGTTGKQPPNERGWFWSLVVGTIDLEGLARDRLKLLGEAAEAGRESISI